MPDKMQVPDGWQVVRLGDVAHERNQRANSASQTEVFSVTKHAGFVRSLEYFDRQVFSHDTSNYKVVRRGDLAYATIHLDEGSLGILRYADAGIISPMYTVFEANKAWTEPEFLFSLMKLPQMVLLYQRIGEGTVHRRKSISFERLGRLSFAIPPPTEQRRILSVLDAIDDAIERTEAVITATERLRDALLHELLTRGVPGWHTEWKDAHGIGTIPACWEVVRLGDVAEVAFSSVDKKTVDGEIPVELCNYTDVFYNRRIRPGMEFMTATASPVERRRWALRKGDVLFTKDSETPDEIGIPAYVTADMPKVLCGYHLGLARPRAELADGAYLAELLRSPRTAGQFARIANGVTRFGLTLGATSSLKILLPPLPEQQAIAAMLDGVDDAIKRANEERSGLQSLKASASDALLSGRVRVG